MLACSATHGSLRFKQGFSTLAVGFLTIGLIGCGGSEQKALPSFAQSMGEAQEALARGDTAAALTALQASIDAQPNSFAYIERIKINAKQGNDAAVEEDVQALLKIDPENRDIGWIRAEMKKPAASRFDANSKQPSMSK